MSADSEFEKSFKKINNISSKVPDEMWANIQLNRKRKRRFGILFFTSAIILTVTFFFLYNQTKKISTYADGKISISDSIKVFSNNSFKQDAKKSFDSIDNKKSTLYKSKIAQQIVLNKIADKTKLSKAENQSGIITDTLSAVTSSNEKSGLLNNEDSNKNNGLIAKTENKKEPNNNFNGGGENEGDKNDDDENDHDPLSVSIFISPDLPFQKTSFTDTLGSKSTLKSLMNLSFTVGARVSYDFNKHFSASLGVQYSQANDRITTATALITHYKTLDFPLLAGYNFSLKNFNAGINAGVILNLKAKRTSNIADTSAYPYYFEKDNLYEQNAGLSYYAGLNLMLYKYKKLGFYAEPYYKYRPANIVNSFASFQQKINTTGILIGVKYNFSKKNNPALTQP